MKNKICNNLSKYHQSIYQTEYNKKKKSIKLTYFFCIFLRAFGLHRFYLNQYLLGLSFIVFYFGFLALQPLAIYLKHYDIPYFFTIFKLFIIISTAMGLVFFIYELTILHKIVNQYNNKISKEIKTQIKKKTASKK